MQTDSGHPQCESRTPYKVGPSLLERTWPLYRSASNLEASKRTRDATSRAPSDSGR